MEAPLDDRPREFNVLVLDFHGTLTRSMDMIVHRSRFDFPDAVAIRAFSEPAWLRRFLTAAHRAGLRLYVATQQEDRYDGLSPMQMRAVQQEETRNRGVATPPEKLAELRDLATYIGGRRLVLRTLNALFDNDETARRAVLPDDHVVTLDWATIVQLHRDTGGRLNKNEHLRRIAERERVEPHQLYLLDDSRDNVDSALLAGYWASLIPQSLQLTLRSWTDLVEQQQHPLARWLQLRIDMAAVSADSPLVQQFHLAVRLALSMAFLSDREFARVSVAATSSDEISSHVAIDALETSLAVPAEQNHLLRCALRELVDAYMAAAHCARAGKMEQCRDYACTITLVSDRLKRYAENHGDKDAAANAIDSMNDAFWAFITAVQAGDEQHSAGALHSRQLVLERAISVAKALQ